MKKINETFDEWKKDDPSSTFIGHNIIEFDESVLEYNLFSHMFYPYVTRKSRGDTLNLARGLYAINPSSIKTPLTERGNPSFKLEKSKIIKKFKPKKAILTYLSPVLDYKVLKKKLNKNITPAYDGMSLNL